MAAVIAWRLMPYMTAKKIQALRALFKDHKIDGYLVPKADEFQGEYVPAHAERLKFLTGFTGSAGIAIVLKDTAIVMSDGRYTIQLSQQVDKMIFQTGDSIEAPPGQWLSEQDIDNIIIGYDPWLHTAKEIAAIEEKIKDKKITLQPIDGNLVDKVWQDRPSPQSHPVEIFPEEIAGLSSNNKIDLISKKLRNKNAYAAIITMPDSIAWLLNIRGNDIPHVPVALSYAYIRQDGVVRWFISPAKVSSQIQEKLGEQVQVIDPQNLDEEVQKFVEEANKHNKPICVDERCCPIWFIQKIRQESGSIISERDPCIWPKACKTNEEQAAMKRTHLRDGAAMVRFLKWLNEEGGKGKQTELSAEAQLESYRQMAPEYRDSSFDTIAGFNAHGAIVHYRADEKSNAVIQSPGLLLVDSGGQYSDGTTDITRTVAIGKVSQEIQKHFTLVLKGHIAVARAVFNRGTTGKDIDILARRPLQEEGLDYAHGTGHGVGCYLSVHEESAHLSTRGEDVLLPGMILSNEPGYYKEGSHGIRIENLILVKEREDKTLEFETISFAPIDQNLIIDAMLDPDERRWLDDYHQKTYELLSPSMNDNELIWLKEATGQ